MIGFLLRWSMNLLALVIAASLIDGIKIRSIGMGILAAGILGIVNAVIRPVVLVLTLPINLLTLGLFTLVINTFLFWLTAQIGQYFGIHLTIDSLLSAFLGGLVVSVVSVVLSMLLKDELKPKPHRS